MKTIQLLFASILCLALSLVFGRAGAQNYDLIDYNINGTPTNGIKIKTQIPFQNSGSMPTIRIEGYDYGGSHVPIGLDIVWYVFNSTFYNPTVSSWGGYTPAIYLYNENGLISIFIDDKPYFCRFHVYAYAKGLSAENATNFSGWTVADELPSGTNQTPVVYKNKFAGIVTVDGNVLVGKATQTNSSYKIDVNGDVRANKIVVNTTGADYVFDSTYQLPSLDSLEKYISIRHHLPGISSAEEMQKDGMDLGNLCTLLLKKNEELILYIMDMNKRQQKLEKQVAELKEDKKTITRKEKAISNEK